MGTRAYRASRERCAPAGRRHQSEDMDLEQLRATCEARVEALRLPHRFSTRDLRDAVAEQRGRPIVLRPP
ncbi:hypothetical protein GCM10020254_73780 [Streptomyces goshikiensis]